ncbi:MAG: shikimate dehydrogenase, partial [Deltaproteobacteria bacterium]|nr:shikimate dehydrogenase [Deltaproteobacteria bacterium]
HGLSHTLSPAMFNAILPDVLPGAEYKVFDIPASDLGSFVRTAHESGIVGFNVTIPHKVAVIPFLDSLDETASALGAVNCVSVGTDGIRVGHNTDASAFEACIRDLDRRFDSALILGAGGAARAVVHALSNVGVPLIVVAERRSAAFEHFLRPADAGAHPPAHAPSAGNRPPSTVDPLAGLPRIPFDPRVLSQEAPEFSLIVNCTPVGMFPNLDASPLEAGFRSGQVVFDLVYRPRPTRLLRLAMAAGATPVDGLCMLARQAAESLRLWTGIEVPHERFLAAAEESASRCTSA